MSTTIQNEPSWTNWYTNSLEKAGVEGLWYRNTLCKCLCVMCISHVKTAGIQPMPDFTRIFTPSPPPPRKYNFFFNDPMNKNPIQDERCSEIWTYISDKHSNNTEYAPPFSTPTLHNHMHDIILGREMGYCTCIDWISGWLLYSHNQVPGAYQPGWVVACGT